MSLSGSRSGRWSAATFALLFLVCLWGYIQGESGAVYMIWLVTLPFSLVCHATANALRDAFGLTFEVRNLVEWGLLGITGLIEYYIIGAGLGSAWRKPS